MKKRRNKLITSILRLIYDVIIKNKKSIYTHICNSTQGEAVYLDISFRGQDYEHGQIPILMVSIIYQVDGKVEFGKNYLTMF